MRHNFELEKRRYTIAAIVVIVLLVYVCRLFHLQVVDDSLEEAAKGNAFYTQTLYPARGEIYDRNGELLVYNQPAYDLMVTIREMKGLDTLAFCRVMGIDREAFDKRMKDIKNRYRNPGYSSYTQQTFATLLSVEDYGVLQEKLYQFPGFAIRPRTIRQYKHKIAPLVLGSICEVSSSYLKRDTTGYYKRGDYIGEGGVEKSYEMQLRGVKGERVLLRDKHGRIIEDRNSENRVVPAQPGKNLVLSLDWELQAYAEQLMQNKVGSVVAIEPKTGEVLCMVSAPTFDPMLLVGRHRGENHKALSKDKHKPFLNRPIQSKYPPGSTFKPTQGLITLQEKIITEHTLVGCSKGYRAGSFKLGCHPHAAPIALVPALATSCNAYFCHAFRAMLDHDKYKSEGGLKKSFDLWKDYMVSMGYGYRLGIDLPGEVRGMIPNVAYYSKRIGPNWKSLNIVSNSIGQGEIEATPLQIANLGATISNRGYYYTPHVVKEIQDTVIDAQFRERHYTMVEEKYYDLIVEGMRAAVTGGTCRGAAFPNVEVCGKTGTVQNGRGKDHSVFMGFAPKDDPKIAICVYVENAGFGATYAVPIGSLVMEKYLNGEIAPNRKYVEANMFKASTKQNVK